MEGPSRNTPIILNKISHEMSNLCPGKVKYILKKYIPARDPKQCVVRIVKGKVERTQNHQWLQASRARATLVVKAWCSFRVAFGRRDTR